MRDAVDVKLGGKTYRVRPTFEAIMRIEAALDRPLLDLCNSSQTGFRLGDMVRVLYEVLRAADVEIELEQVGRTIVDEGLLSFIGPVSELMRAALGAGPEHPASSPGEAKSPDTD